MRGHLQCRDTLAGNEGCPLKTGTTVIETRLQNEANGNSKLIEICGPITHTRKHFKMAISLNTRSHLVIVSWWFSRDTARLLSYFTTS